MRKQLTIRPRFMAGLLIATMALALTPRDIYARLHDPVARWSKLYLNEGFLQLTNLYATATGKRTFTISADGDDGPYITSGDTGAPGFFAQRTANDSNAMNDSASVGGSSAGGTFVLNADGTDAPSLLLCPGPEFGGANCDPSTWTRVWSEDGGSNGGIQTGVGLFKASEIFTGIDTNAGTGDAFEFLTGTLSAGTASLAVAAGQTLNSCVCTAETAGVHCSGGTSGAERTFHVDTGGGTDTGAVTALCSVHKAYGG